MKALLQRVTSASVSIGGEVVGKIGRGLVIFIGVAVGDTDEDARYLVHRAVNLRIFADELGKFNLSALDIGGELLIVSQFTLLADTKKGRRPSFVEAAPPDQAEQLFEQSYVMKSEAYANEDSETWGADALYAGAVDGYLKSLILGAGLPATGDWNPKKLDKVFE